MEAFVAIIMVMAFILGLVKCESCMARDHQEQQAYYTTCKVKCAPYLVAAGYNRQDETCVCDTAHKRIKR